MHSFCFFFTICLLQFFRFHLNVLIDDVRFVNSIVMRIYLGNTILQNLIIERYDYYKSRSMDVGLNLIKVLLFSRGMTIYMHVLALSHASAINSFGIGEMVIPDSVSDFINPTLIYKGD